MEGDTLPYENTMVHEDGRKARLERQWRIFEEKQKAKRIHSGLTCTAGGRPTSSTRPTSANLKWTDNDGGRGARPQSARGSFLGTMGQVDGSRKAQPTLATRAMQEKASARESEQPEFQPESPLGLFGIFSKESQTESPEARTRPESRKPSTQKLFELHRVSSLSPPNAADGQLDFDPDFGKNQTEFSGRGESSCSLTDHYVLSEEEDSIEDILVEELGGKTYRVPQHRLKQETNYVSLPVDNEMEENKADHEAPDATDRTLVTPLVPLASGDLDWTATREQPEETREKRVPFDDDDESVEGMPTADAAGTGGGDATTEMTTEGKEFFEMMRTRKDEFLFTAAPHQVTVQCLVTRNKKGVEKGMFPTYELTAELDGGREVTLLTGRKRKKTKTIAYVIYAGDDKSTREENKSPREESELGLVKSNLLGTHFTISNKVNGKKMSLNGIRNEMAVVVYECNILGLKGPRRMTLVVPGMTPEGHRVELKTKNESDSLVTRFKSQTTTNLITMENKTPVWNTDTESFVLNFKGRVTKASIKNFQIIHSKDPDYIVMQFGRISPDRFTLDYRYPLCALQAFGIALTSFESKLACE